VTSRFQTWDRLPLFVDEEAVANALMVRGKTVEWRQIAERHDGDRSATRSLLAADTYRGAT
jgi:hypothetical protein